MSTRANILIKMIDKPTVQLYHHSDGYPDGVGSDLSVILTGNINEKDWDTPIKLGNFIEDADSSFEYEGENCSPHGDIEYLYTIDIDKQEITCKDVYYDKIVYTSSMWDKWNDVTVND